MVITVENRDEFGKLAKKIVGEDMVKIPVDKEHVVVELLLKVFDAGYTLASSGKVEIEI